MIIYFLASLHFKNFRQNIQKQEGKNLYIGSGFFKLKVQKKPIKP